MRLAIQLLTLIVTLTAAGMAKAACDSCQTVDFNKKIELQLLRPMVQMTTVQKLDHMRSFGLEIYQGEDPDKLPKTLAFLPSLPVEENPGMKQYSEIFKEAWGIYLTPSNYSYRVQKPTILVVDSADDWTLIHEFAHFLFDRARNLEHVNAESLKIVQMNNAKEDFFESWGGYKNRGSFTSSEQRTLMIESFVTFMKSQLYFLKVFQLEESTIEKLVMSWYEKYKPVDYKPSQIERSRRYIRRTSISAQETLRVALETCQDMRAILGRDHADLLANVNQICKNAEDLKEQSLALVKSLRIDLTEKDQTL